MWDALLDLVLPRHCVGCGAPGVAVCTRCRGGELCLAEYDGIGVAVAGFYRDGLRAALIAYKERGRHDLARPLGERLGAALDLIAGQRVGAVLVPVPSASAARRRRGGDHVARLARHAARPRSLAVVPALRQVRPVLDQSALGSAARRANLDGALVAAAAPPGRAAVVVDDIVTTGATVGESVRALRAAGWPVLGAAVVAATPAPGRR